MGSGPRPGAPGDPEPADLLDPAPEAQPDDTLAAKQVPEAGVAAGAAPPAPEAEATRAEYDGPSGSPLPGSRPELALSIAGAARRLGVATATLRSWERRYGLVPSRHTKGGHRRYGPVDLARLQIMHRLVRSGVPAAEAAGMAISADLTAPDRTGPFAALLWPDPERPEPSQILPAVQDGAEGGARAEPPAAGLAADADPDLVDATSDPLTDADTEGRAAQVHHGGGRVLPLPRGSASARGLASSVMALDVDGIDRAVATSLDRYGTVATWEQLVRPVMAGISRRWDSTGAGVEIEHTFSEAVVAALARHSGRAQEPRNDPPVLLATVPEELHDLPLLALQATLAENRIRTHLLGARTPPDALVGAVRRLGPPVVFVWAQMEVAEAPAIPHIRPRPEVILAGPGFSGPRAALVGATSLADASDQVHRALGL
jgi:MerR family transcriptional regulator, light-induced transcriptional regulator